MIKWNKNFRKVGSLFTCRIKAAYQEHELRRTREPSKYPGCVHNVELAASIEQLTAFPV